METQISHSPDSPDDGSCVRLRPQRPNHVWAYDFVADRTHNGKAFRMLTVIDEFTRESLAIVVDRQLRSDDVLATLTELFVQRGPPEYIRSDNGPEFCAKAVRGWLKRLDVKTLFIDPGSPWENGYVESFNGKLRDELLDREVFSTLLEARTLIEDWRLHYNQVRPHSALGYRPPAPETVLWPGPPGQLAHPSTMTCPPISGPPVELGFHLHSRDQEGESCEENEVHRGADRVRPTAS